MSTFNASCPKVSVNLSGEHAESRSFSQRKAITRLAAAILVTLLTVLIAPTASRAQVLYGSLVGNVSDPKGSVIPGAKVEVTNVGTAETRTATTDDRGAYILNDLQVGVYKITVSRASFKTLLKEDLKIEANRTFRFDAQLEVGEVQETVVVTAGQ